MSRRARSLAVWATLAAYGRSGYRAMVERLRHVEELGFDWISLSEHHYSPRILTPSPPLAAAYLASHVDTIKIALLGPIVPVSNPIRVAEELAMNGLLFQRAGNQELDG
jgi:alkanesulfonate monooxygenase SsuD/methylene tetrahydromethanopterin reductase-like flavin-dependent oxidoreductase (luciferase family)